MLCAFQHYPLAFVNKITGTCTQYRVITWRNSHITQTASIEKKTYILNIRRQVYEDVWGTCSLWRSTDSRKSCLLSSSSATVSCLSTFRAGASVKETLVSHTRLNTKEKPVILPFLKCILIYSYILTLGDRERVDKFYGAKNTQYVGLISFFKEQVGFKHKNIFFYTMPIFFRKSLSVYD